MPSAQLIVGSELALLAAVFDHPQKGIGVSCKADVVPTVAAVRRRLARWLSVVTA
jgi:hypothetical protein